MAYDSAMAQLLGQRDQATNALFSVPHPHLQHMAGETIYPGAGRFLPVDPNAPWIAQQRYENAQIQPSGQRILPNPSPPNVLTFSPRAIDKYLR